MRWGYRVLVLLATATLVLGSCSGKDDKASDAAARSSTTSSSSTSTSTSTSTTTVTTTAPAVAATSRSSTRTTKTTRAAAPVTTRPPATTTTHATCLATAAGSAQSFGADKPDDPTPASVTIGNQHSGTVIVVLRGTSYTIGAGGSQTVSLAPLHHSEVMTAAAASKPSDRFAYTVTLLPHSGYTINVKTMDIGTCNTAGVRQAVYLRQDGFQGGL